MSTHLVFTCSHAHPDYNNDRFRILGNLIVDRKPDRIINLGDMADMPSLCSYDFGTKSFEGRRYTKDVKANIEANTELFTPLFEYNQRQKDNKKAQYKPKMDLLYGNHEHRIVKAVEHDPKLEGVISLEDLQNETFGWRTHKFLDIIERDGVYYSHYFTSGVMGRPVSGENPASALLRKKFASCTQGHVHTRDFCEKTAPDGTKLQALIAGCYFDYHADYAGPANSMYWRGVVFKHHVKDGQYDHEWISMDTLRKHYG